MEIEKITVPVHQFEIRYTKILDFQAQIKEVIAPFVPLAIDVLPENENRIELCRYTLLFQSYTIFVTWDRIVFRTEGNIELFKENNSIVEEPFFNLFNKLRTINSFGNVTNCLIVTHVLNHSGKEDVRKDFINKFFNEKSINKVIPDSTDVAIVLEKTGEGKQINLQFGPYLGLSDLQKRNIVPQYQENFQHLNTIGEMAEIKIFEQLKSISFTKYKELVKLTLEIRDALWQN